MPLFLLFVAVPILEIALFIQIGGFLGLWPTLAIVIITAFLGTTLVRTQGVRTLLNLQNSLASGQSPLDSIAHGAFILVAGVLLLTPGFFTDAVGLSFLIPPVRSALISWGATKIISKNTVVFTQNQDIDPDIVDADYTVVEDTENTPKRNSGWTKPE